MKSFERKVSNFRIPAYVDSTRGFLRQPEEWWMKGDCLIFTSPDVPSVPCIGWHRDIQHGAAGYNYSYNYPLNFQRSPYI
jgi:hypothetical protein